MSHKLLIELEYEYSNEQFKEMLGKLEFPRGSTVNFVLKITNIDETPFTGKLEKITADFERIESTSTSSFEIISLQPNDKISYEIEFTMYDEGRNWIKCIFSSNDGEPVECYQNRDFSPWTNEWKRSFRVVNKEDLVIINLLKDILAKIH